MSRCYVGDACPEPAEYKARLTWTEGLVLLCVGHAARERAFGDVVSIRYLDRPEQEGRQ